jgi:pimeloyl-ACP methyl ester carboxylesterase
MGKQIYLFHGKGGSPNGSVRILEEALRFKLPGTNFIRPLLRHSDLNVLAEDSLAGLAELRLLPSAIVIGISLGGLIAARHQEIARPDLTVVCISSPTWADAVRVERSVSNRAAFYSSNDEVIAGRTAEWATLAAAWDITTLTHDTDQHAELLARGIAAYLNGEDVLRALAG